MLTVHQKVKVLKEWTGKETAELVYDTTTCDFSHNAFNVCFKSPNNAVIGVTEDGDIFGGFGVVVQINEYTPNPNHFIFSLDSHCRCCVPQRWRIKPEKQATSVMLFNDSSDFIRFGAGDGEGRLYFISGQNQSFCCNLSESYDGVGDLWLYGKNHDWGHEQLTGRVTLRRLFVLRLS